MDRFTKAMGEGDEDVMNLKAGIGGLVFGNWSDEDIAAGVMEMVRDERAELASVMDQVATHKPNTI